MDRNIERIQIRILGIVQGVGFRPFVYRLATELKLDGWVRNDGQGVTIEVDGPTSTLLEFLSRLQSDRPAPSYIYAIDHRFLEKKGFRLFEIVSSEESGIPTVWILPDLATCGECRRELLNAADRRYRYPFINCTHCGPRFTIIEQLPYDRARTSMKSFAMCVECLREYSDPLDRRFHAQPDACAVCGPRLQFWSNSGEILGEREDALKLAVQCVVEGRILGAKGLGGYHLIADARNENAAALLRSRKKRQNKPFAVMMPDLSTMEHFVEVPAFAFTFLTSTQAPIIILPRTGAGWNEIAESVAPKSPYLGVFLPYSPLHLLLLHDLGFPVIATSGNLTEEPIEFADESASQRLASLCDGFLIHNRSIVHHADDSVMQVVTRPAIKPQMLRRARGYTPLPVLASRELPPLLAVGGHMNGTFALSRGREIIVSQHLGDLNGYEARESYKKTLADFMQLYGLQPERIAHDLHPDYFTTQLALEMRMPTVAVQHHHAHLAACMLENQLEEPMLGLTWDGTGYGTDRTVWGGEYLYGDARSFKRVASLHPFRLPASEKGIKETWRTALSLLWEAFGDQLPRDLPLFSAIPEQSIDLTLQILKKGLFSPVTTSMGRLFDGVSAILGMCYFNTHQAEAAQLLEYAAWSHGTGEIKLPISLYEDGILRVDWRETVRSIVEQFLRGVPIAELAAGFHQTIIQSALHVTNQLAAVRVAMAGGVFCNRYLTEGLLVGFDSEGKKGYIHSQFPPTDGSLSLGQLWVAAHQESHGDTESRS